MSAKTDHERGWEDGYKAALHDARWYGSRAYHELWDDSADGSDSCVCGHCGCVRSNAELARRRWVSVTTSRARP